MTRLHTELHRLYDLDATGSTAVRQTDHSPSIRTVVIELSRPADWSALAQLWHEVQAELHLPAPAIAVNGADGYQLWFSFAEALPLAQAHAFAKALCAHYLSDVSPERLTVQPSADPPILAVPPHAKSIDQWSAFVAPDLAPVFSETPWLDVQPSPDGQADLLCHLKSIKLPDLRAALTKLQLTQVAVEDMQMPMPRALKKPDTDPKQFLIDVMKNEALAMHLRIEAAKALLPYFEPPR